MLERCGRLFSEIHPLILYALTGIPFLLTSLYFTIASDTLAQEENRSRSLFAKTIPYCEKEAKKRLWLSRYGQSDPYFLDHELESHPLLSREIDFLDALSLHPALKDRTELNKRLAFLSGDDNRLTFVEETIRSTHAWKETHEKLLHPVQIDEEDLQRLLKTIEGEGEMRPQLLISDLKLNKKQFPFHNEGFELDLRLLKRESP